MLLLQVASGLGIEIEKNFHVNDCIRMRWYFDELPPLILSLNVIIESPFLTMKV